jgi:outer membrane protein TolC
VITAQDELARASDNQIGALYQFNLSRAALARATGTIGTMYTK